MQQNVTHRHAEMTADSEGEEKQQIEIAIEMVAKQSTALIRWYDETGVEEERERETEWMSYLRRIQRGVKESFYVC